VHCLVFSGQDHAQRARATALVLDKSRLSGRHSHQRTMMCRHERQLCLFWQALGAAREATSGWGTNTASSRRAAYEAAEAAALSSAAAHRQHRSAQA
jgi:hypothetical protein